jgi:hypothetical protein
MYRQAARGGSLDGIAKVLNLIHGFEDRAIAQYLQGAYTSAMQGDQAGAAANLQAASYFLSPLGPLQVSPHPNGQMFVVQRGVPGEEGNPQVFVLTLDQITEMAHAYINLPDYQRLRMDTHFKALQEARDAERHAADMARAALGRRADEIALRQAEIELAILEEQLKQGILPGAAGRRAGEGKDPGSFWQDHIKKYYGDGADGFRPSVYADENGVANMVAITLGQRVFERLAAGVEAAGLKLSNEYLAQVTDLALHPEVSVSVFQDADTGMWYLDLGVAVGAGGEGKSAEMASYYEPVPIGMPQDPQQAQAMLASLVSALGSFRAASVSTGVLDMFAKGGSIPDRNLVASASGLQLRDGHFLLPSTAEAYSIVTTKAAEAAQGIPEARPSRGRGAQAQSSRANPREFVGGGGGSPDESSPVVEQGAQARSRRRSSRRAGDPRSGPSEESLPGREQSTRERLRRGIPKRSADGDGALPEESPPLEANPVQPPLSEIPPLEDQPLRESFPRVPNARGDRARYPYRNEPATLADPTGFVLREAGGRHNRRVSSYPPDQPSESVRRPPPPVSSQVSEIDKLQQPEPLRFPQLPQSPETAISGINRSGALPLPEPQVDAWSSQPSRLPANVAAAQQVLVDAIAALEANPFRVYEYITPTKERRKVQEAIEVLGLGSKQAREYRRRLFLAELRARRMQPLSR